MDDGTSWVDSRRSRSRNSCRMDTDGRWNKRKNMLVGEWERDNRHLGRNKNVLCRMDICLVVDCHRDKELNEKKHGVRGRKAYYWTAEVGRDRKRSRSFRQDKPCRRSG